MARKKDPKMEQAYDLDIAEDEAAAAEKLPANITGGVQPLSDYMEIPCDKIIEYQDKQSSDFQPWPEEKFEELVESVRDVGVLEAVSVRINPNKPGVFEMLSGEHRWKASMAAGRKTIPAHVLRNCSDQMARTIFSLPNVLRRDNSIRDLINGWWTYAEAIRFKRQDKIEQLIDEGVISPELRKDKVPLRSVYRYAKLHDLIEEYLVMLDTGALNLASAEPISYLTQEQQTFLLPYKDKLKSKAIATKIRDLARGEIAGLTWSKEGIKAVLDNKPVKKEPAKITFKTATAQAKTVLKARLAPEYYGATEQILNDALDLYFSQHPEAKLDTKTK